MYAQGGLNVKKRQTEITEDRRRLSAGSVIMGVPCFYRRTQTMIPPAYAGGIIVSFPDLTRDGNGSSVIR